MTTENNRKCAVCGHRRDCLNCSINGDNHDAMYPGRAVPNTPTPWILTKSKHGIPGDHKTIAVIGEDLGDRALIIHAESGLDGQDDANAALLFAAPDMQSALEAIIFQVCQGKVLERDACISAARKAVAKSKAGVA